MLDPPVLAEQQSLFTEQISSESDEPTFRLSELEVYNWGPFQGLHRVDFDEQGTAIIGPTGSGKTTLVDALMTLLVAQPRYNLASTGGHESDRTLISYVRGVLGGDGSDGREEVARPGKTITGICGTYTNGSETLRLGGLLWTEGTSNATGDLKRRWLFSSAEEQSFQHWLQLLHDEGIRELMRTGRETANLRIFESKKSYLAHTRKFFDVSENAFTLLNRAAGLKQLNSIDEIFRDLVLDDRTAFDRALEVAKEFDNLAGIRAELETAKRQRDTLLPIAAEHQQLLKARKKEKQLQLFKRIVPVWFAISGRDRWAHEVERLSGDLEKLEAQLSQQQAREQDSQARVETLRERYLQLGGNVVTQLETTITMQEERVAQREKQAADYQRLASRFQLAEELSEASLLRNQAQVESLRERLSSNRNDQQKKTLETLARLQTEQENLAQLESTRQKVEDRPGSNIPPRFQDFRNELAVQLRLPEADLPYLAELVEVQPGETAWRGAIERALGSERLRILVPEDSLDEALRWVNDRDNRLHVRLQRAAGEEPASEFFPDGFARKLNLKDHPLAATARRLISRRDLHCVDSPEQLRTTEHALTIEGMMSGRQGRFEKQDQRRLTADWMTGFDNKDQLKSLAAEIDALRGGVARLSTESDSQRQELTKLEEQLQLLDALSRIDFASIDLLGAQAELARSQERLTELLDPKSDASQAKAQYDSENSHLKSLQQALRELSNQIAVVGHDRDQAEQQRAKAELRIGPGLTEEETALAKKNLSISPELAAGELHDTERDVLDAIDRKLNNQRERVTGHEQRLVRFMETALHEDTGALAETGSTIEDIPDYLERLRVLNEEALPEKQSRFLEYLNRSSDQGATQLLAGINEEVDAIEGRIRELNQTLRKVDFRSGRYLQLQPRRITHERLRSLETAIRHVRSAALKDDQGESHYKALRTLMEILREAGENRRLQGSRALLDPRYRLQFFVVEVDRKTGRQSPPRTGSQSGSGGEKELMASHILTASLSYALCPPEANRPLYGTVVLDEAFSKSSPSAASRIIEALRIFCLHPIFVTPNKEIGLLKQHTRKVICVQRIGKEASLASITWQRLAELASGQ